VVRLARALRPDGINWPELEDGSPSNKLELLSQANNIEHAHAHDALSDVEATIGMARLLRDKQPKLYQYAFENRGKQAVQQMLNFQQRKPCIQVSGMIPGAFGHTSIVVPLARHPVNQNGIIVLDLRTDPEQLFELNAEQIAARVFTTAEKLADSDRIHLRTVQTNKCPVLVPLATMKPDDAARLNIDLEQQKQRADVLANHFSDKFADTVRQSMVRDWEATTDDVDGSLYSGAFFDQEDKDRFKQIRQASPSALSELGGYFKDPRCEAMLLRYRARNFPESLTKAENEDWQTHINERLHNDDAPWLSESKFNQIMNEVEWTAAEESLRKSLVTYAQQILQ